VRNNSEAVALAMPFCGTKVPFPKKNSIRLLAKLRFPIKLGMTSFCHSVLDTESKNEFCKNSIVSHSHSFAKKPKGEGYAWGLLSSFFISLPKRSHCFVK